MLITFFINRGQNLAGKGIGQAAKAIEKNMMTDEAAAAHQNDSSESDDADDAPIFTPELARLKAKEAGKELPPSDNDDENDDAEMDDDDEEAREGWKR